MDYLTLAREFAKKIQQDERVIELARAKEANDKDEALQNLIGQFNLLRIDMNREVGKPERDDSRLMELDRQLQEIYAQIMQNPNMEAFNKARQNIDTMMNTINQALTVAINGGDPDLVEESHGCGCGCESCGGDCGGECGEDCGCGE